MLAMASRGLFSSIREWCRFERAHGEDQMDCPSCGKQQDPSNKYCETCGALIVPEEEPVSADGMFAQPSPTVNETSGTSYSSFSGYAEAPRPAERPVVANRLLPPPGSIAAAKALSFRLAHGEQILKAYD